jgi:hypothetical protein
MGSEFIGGNSIALLILMTDGFVFRSSYVPSDVKSMVGILNIIMVIFAGSMSFRQAYLSRISKVRKRFFEGKISGFDSDAQLINLQFSPDADILSAYHGENLVNSKIKIGIEWKSDKLPEEAVRRSSFAEVITTSAIPIETSTELVTNPSPSSRVT